MLISRCAIPSAELSGFRCSQRGHADLESAAHGGWMTGCSGVVPD
jgi:hypothetical protein